MLKASKAEGDNDLQITKKRNKVFPSGLTLRKRNNKTSKEQLESDISTGKVKEKHEDLLEKNKKSKEKKDITSNDISSVNTTSVYPLVDERSGIELEKNREKENIMPTSVSIFKEIFDQKVADDLKTKHTKIHHTPIIRCSSLENGVITFENCEKEEKRNRRKLRDMKSRSFCGVDHDVGLVARRQHSWEGSGSLEDLNTIGRRGKNIKGKMIEAPFAPYQHNNDSAGRICMNSLEHVKILFNKNTHIQDDVKVTLRPRPLHLRNERPKSICLGTNSFEQNKSHPNCFLKERSNSDLDLTRIASSTVINTNKKMKKLPFKKKKKTLNIRNNRNSDVLNNLNMLHKILSDISSNDITNSNSELNVVNENRSIDANNICSNEENDVVLKISNASNSHTINNINLNVTDDINLFTNIDSNTLQGNGNVVIVLSQPEENNAVNNDQPIFPKACTKPEVWNKKPVATGRVKESIKKFGVSPMNKENGNNNVDTNERKKKKYLNMKDDKVGENGELDIAMQILGKPSANKAIFNQQATNDVKVTLRPRPKHLRNERPKSMDFRVSLSAFEQNQLHSNCILQEKSGSDLDLTRIASSPAIDRKTVKKKLPFKKKKKVLNDHNDIVNCLDSGAPCNINLKAGSDKDSNITDDNNSNVVKTYHTIVNDTKLSNCSNIDSPIIIVNDTKLSDVNNINPTFPSDIDSNLISKSNLNDIKQSVSIVVTNHVINSSFNVQKDNCHIEDQSKVRLRPRLKNLRDERPKSMDFSLGLNTIEQNKVKSNYLSNYLPQEKFSSDLVLTRIASTEALNINIKKKKLPFKKKKKAINVHNVSASCGLNSNIFSNKDLKSVNRIDSNDIHSTDTKPVNEPASTVGNHIDLDNMNDSISNDLRALDVGVSNNIEPIALDQVDSVVVNDISSNKMGSNEGANEHGELLSSVKLVASKSMDPDNADSNYNVSTCNSTINNAKVTHADNTNFNKKIITTERDSSGKRSLKEFQNIFEQQIGNGLHQERRPRGTNLFVDSRAKSVDFEYNLLGQDELQTNLSYIGKSRDDLNVTGRQSPLERKVERESPLEAKTNRTSFLVNDTNTLMVINSQLPEGTPAKRNVCQISLVEPENILIKDKSSQPKDVRLVKDTGESKINKVEADKIFNGDMNGSKVRSGEDIRKDATDEDRCNSNKDNVASDETKNVNINSTDNQVTKSKRLNNNTRSTSLSVQESAIPEKNTKTKTNNKLPFIKKNNDSRILKAMKIFQSSEVT